MFWSDIRSAQQVGLNCALVKHLLEGLNPENYVEYEDCYVESLTRRMESYIIFDLARGKPITIWQALMNCLED